MRRPDAHTRPDWNSLDRGCFGKLAQKLAEPDAGLGGHKVAILNPADRSVVASGITDRTGLFDFDVPAGTYVLVGASDEPQNVQVQAGQTLNFKLVVH